MTSSKNVTVSLTSELRLEQALKDADVEDPASVRKLAISGEVTEADFWFIHENMADTLQELDTGDVAGCNRINAYMCGGIEDMDSVVIPKSDKPLYCFWNGRFVLTYTSNS
jgi:hypothetical protein